MPRPRMVMALAKVMIAAAWADGNLTREELNSLKDLLFRLPEMNARQWSELEIYMETPVEAAERERLVAELQAAMRSRADRELAISALQDLVQADGELSNREQEVLAEIRADLENANVSIFGHVGRLLSGPIDRRSDAVAHAPNRELFLEDFIRNRIFYKLSRYLEREELNLDLPEETLRKLSLAGGLMARVAYVDREISDAEFDQMAAALESYMDLEPDAAAFVAGVAVDAVSKDLDYYRLSRQFFDYTTPQERRRFLDVLFAVAAADDRVSHEEMEEIRTIAKVLKLTHKQFIDAKLTVPRERRAY